MRILFLVALAACFYCSSAWGMDNKGYDLTDIFNLDHHALCTIIHKNEKWERRVVKPNDGCSEKVVTLMQRGLFYNRVIQLTGNATEGRVTLYDFNPRLTGLSKLLIGGAVMTLATLATLYYLKSESEADA